MPEDHHQSDEVDLVTIAKRGGPFDFRPADIGAVCARMVFDRSRGVAHRDPGMAPGNTGRQEANGRCRITTDEVLSAAQWEAAAAVLKKVRTDRLVTVYG